MSKRSQRTKKRKTIAAPQPHPVELAPPAREYIYSFELSRPFPNVRTFIFKKPLSKSMADTFKELFGTSKKRPGV
jgi:hypothetical protein